MLKWPLYFLIFAIIAAVFGFGGIATTSAGFAKVLFYIFIGLFLISLVLKIADKGDKRIT